MDSQPAMMIRRISRQELQQLPEAQFEAGLADQNGDESLAPPWQFENAEAADYCLSRIIARYSHATRMAALHKAEAQQQAERAERFIRRYADLFGGMAEGKRSWQGDHSAVKFTCQDRLPALKLVDQDAAAEFVTSKMVYSLNTPAVRQALEAGREVPGVQVTPQERLAWALPGGKDAD